MGHSAALHAGHTARQGDGGRGVEGGEQEDLTDLLHAFPDYRAAFLETQVLLMQGPGSLPAATRHYAALLACSQLHCPRLAAIEARAFLLAGGSPAWLAPDPATALLLPARIRTLATVNRVMAVQPWLLAPHHVRGLTVGPSSWSLGQAVQALAILAHYHALCSLERAEAPADPAMLQGKENRGGRPRPLALLMVQDFCWAEEGYSVLSPFSSELAGLLDDKFRAVGKVVAGQGEQARAVWDHTRAASGVGSDDCNYPAMRRALGEDTALRELVDRSLGAGPGSGPGLGLGPGLGHAVLPPAKKALVALVVLEARLQSELLFALRAVMELMT